jgi:hypothetical protein
MLQKLHRYQRYIRQLMVLRSEPQETKRPRSSMFPIMLYRHREKRATETVTWFDRDDHTLYRKVVGNYLVSFH